MNAPRVAVLVPATQKYTVFVPAILASLEKYFLKDCTVELIVLTDLPKRVPVRTLYIAHQPWPGVAIHKLHYLCQYAQELAEFDYLYVCDADMRVVAPVGREILGDLVVTKHAYFYGKPLDELPYERNPASTAYIAPGRGTAYFQKAFLGGRYANMLALGADPSAGIDADYANGLEAVWHDESHVNRYVVDHPPEVMLSPSYCYPEGSDFPFEPKILALNKDHAVIRSSGIKPWFIRGERLARRVLSKAKSLVVNAG